MFGSSSSLRPWILIVAGPCRRNTGERYCGRLARILRGARNVAAIDRTSLIVLEEERPWWQPIVDRFGVQHVVEQPFDRGSGTGILIALRPIAEREPDAPLLVIETERDGRALQHRSTAGALLDRFALAQPTLFAEVADHGTEAAGGLDGLYPFLPWTDLERDVVAPFRSSTALIHLPDIGDHRADAAFDAA